MLMIRWGLGFIISIQVFAASAQDKDLNYYIGQGIRNSPLLNDYRNQALAGKYDSLLLRAGFKTQVNANSAGSYAPIIHGFGYDYALSNGKTFNALLSVNRQLTGRNILNNQLQGIKLQLDSVTAASKISEQELRKAIIAQYITAFASQQQKDFSQQVYKLLSKEDTVLKKLTRANVYKQVDYLTFLVTFQQQQLQLKQAFIQFNADYAALNYLSGISDTSSAKLTEPTLTAAPGIDVQSSIFLAQFRLDSLSLQNQQQLIGFNYRPRAGVYADAGYNSSFAGQGYKNFGTSIGFTVSIPIYDGGRQKLQYSKLDIARRTRNTYRDFYLVQYRQQTAQLKRQIKETEELNAQISKQIRFTESLIKADAKLLETGDIRVSDFIIAINNYMDSQNLLRQTNISRLQLISQLNYWNK